MSRDVMTDAEALRDRLEKLTTAVEGIDTTLTDRLDNLTDAVKELTLALKNLNNAPSSSVDE